MKKLKNVAFYVSIMNNFHVLLCCF